MKLSKKLSRKSGLTKTRKRQESSRHALASIHRFGTVTRSKPMARLATKSKVHFRVKMDQSVAKLQRINAELKKAVYDYDEMLGSDDVDISAFLDDISQEIQKKSLPGFNGDMENPATFVEDLTVYIDGDIVRGYKKAGDIAVRVKVAKDIIQSLSNAVEMHRGELEDQGFDDLLASMGKLRL